MEVMNAVKRGSVVWFNGSKGYGFLLDKASGDEYFVHFSAIQSEGYKTLKENDKVEFGLDLGPKGKMQAANVRVIS